LPFQKSRLGVFNLLTIKIYCFGHQIREKKRY